jgi:hypothetical protein
MCNLSDIFHLYQFERRVIDAWTEMFAAPDAYTGCHLFDVSDWKDGSTATHHRPSGNSMLRWQAKENHRRKTLWPQTCRSV